MKKFAFSVVLGALVLALPMTSLAKSDCGYYDYYTDYQKVSSYEPVTRYVCDSGRWNDYYGGRNCYYKTEYVKTYKYESVQKKKWVNTSCRNDRYDDYYTSSYYGYGNNNSYVRGYDNGYYDGAYGYSYSPYSNGSYYGNNSYYGNSYYNNYNYSSYYGNYGNYYSPYYGYYGYSF